jgi:hypothetical protein
MCLGIPVNDFPVNEDGVLDLTNWHQWLAQRRAVEEEGCVLEKKRKRDSSLEEQQQQGLAASSSGANIV